MFFYIQYPFQSTSGIRLVQSDEAHLYASPVPGTLYLQPGKQQLECLDLPQGMLILLGDPVFANPDQLIRAITDVHGRLDEAKIFENIKGHFYWFYIHGDRLCCGSSYGAVFPVYYHRTKDSLSICSSSFFLAEKLDDPERDRRNLLERMLFNYPFFDSTWWKGIKLLDTHRYIILNGSQTAITRGFNLETCFGPVETTEKESLYHLADVFQETSRVYFPEEPFAVSMTGGFDGRTLVAAAGKERDFFTYSFGKPGTSDVEFPRRQAVRLGLDYFPIELDARYVRESSLESAQSFMRLSENNGNLGRPHYHYAARLLSEKVRYILTGNFGSELFRALHLPGVMMSENLIRIFASQNGEWKDALQSTVSTWKGISFERELEELMEDLSAYLKNMEGWDQNHRFYYFVFTEISRKYFGPELIMQSTFLRNRTPYMDLSFFRELNRTPWSGVHSRLFEKNKGKRMKGQLFYASFLRQTHPVLYRMKTSKGYCPADVLIQSRFPLLMARLAYQKLLKTDERDSQSVEAFFNRHHRSLKREILTGPKDPWLTSMLDPSGTEIISGKNLDHWVRIYSLAYGWNAAARPALQKTNYLQKLG